jgi:hypothetical protein
MGQRLATRGNVVKQPLDNRRADDDRGFPREDNVSFS